jgi:hypothetical protein
MNELMELENTIVECELFLQENKGKEFKVLSELVKETIALLKSNVIQLNCEYTDNLH